jgi:hypothetical protein
MAKPQWTYPSRTSLGIIQERRQTTIPVLVFDNEDRSTVETINFENFVDSTILPNYSNDKFFWIQSIGLAQTPWLGEGADCTRYSPKAQSYVFKFPRDQITIDGESTTVVPRRNFYKDKDNNLQPFVVDEFFGVAINGVPFKSPKTNRIVRMGEKYYTENSYIMPCQEILGGLPYSIGPNQYPANDYFVDGSGVIESDRKFFYQSDPRLLYSKDPTKHSPIIGYAFDGNPIYGPFGYADPLPQTETDPATGKLRIQGNPALKVMKSSYRLTEVQRENHTLPDGTFIEDFVYQSGLGDLDEHNGRFCKTPEYPGGIYAYFITVDPDDVNLPRYPYILGPTYYEEPLLPNGEFKFPGDISLEVISGQIPRGMRIEGLTITGVPFEVENIKQFRFVLRARNADGFSDRTYTLTVDGPDSPVWETPTGDLEIGTRGTRTDEEIGILDIIAVTGNTAIKLTSVIDIQRDSVVTCPDYPNSIALSTSVVSINSITKTLTLSKPLIGVIPNGTELLFKYTRYHSNLYVLDNQYVNYQLNAVDSDTATGSKLKYYIPPRGGVLPPGLTLSEDGVISGFTEALLANEQVEFNGNYDMQLYDKYGYDYGVRPYNGFDSFLYDTVFYDYSDASVSPRKINRYYQFIVRVTDGINYSDRRFRIFLVGDDFFRADVTYMNVGNSTFTADSTPIRAPFWLTPSYLGRRRANNYITTYLDVYDSSTLSGQLAYVLDPVNNDGTPSQLPPGMRLDQITGEIYGDVPYQPAVTKTYKFSVRAINYDNNNPLHTYAKLSKNTSKAGRNILYLNDVLNLQLNSLVTQPPGAKYITPGSIITAIDPINNTVTLNTLILQDIPAGQKFLFNYLVSSAKTFTIDIMGEIDSTIRFITAGDLGTIPANFISELNVEAVTTVPNATLSYSLVGGKLPPGLTLVSDGTIQGKVNQYATEDTPGLTTFDGATTTIDRGSTTIDRQFTFIVLAQDQFQYSAVTKIFTVTVTTPNDLLYSNIFVKPFLSREKRETLSGFFSNTDIFEYNLLYRPTDPEFGIQSQLKMLVYAGIETRKAEEYAAALGRSSRKKYRFGRVKKAVAKTPGTNKVIYEAVYVEVIDDLENSKGSVSKEIITRFTDSPITVNQSTRDLWDSEITDNNIAQSNLDILNRIWMQDNIMTADFSGQLVSDINKSNVFGNSTTNIRGEISKLGETEKNFRPLWMRTPQSFSGIAERYVKGIVLCYVKPGNGDRIINNIKNLGVDFKSIDFTVDRIIIDSVKDEQGDKYIAFGAREIING